MAVSKGLVLTKAEFKKNPTQSLGFAIAFLAPLKVIGIGTKGAKTSIKIINKSAKA